MTRFLHRRVSSLRGGAPQAAASRSPYELDYTKSVHTIHTMYLSKSCGHWHHIGQDCQPGVVQKMNADRTNPELRHAVCARMKPSLRDILGKIPSLIISGLRFSLVLLSCVREFLGQITNRSQAARSCVPRSQGPLSYAARQQDLQCPTPARSAALITKSMTLKPGRNLILEISCRELEAENPKLGTLRSRADIALDGQSTVILRNEGSTKTVS